MSNVIYKKDLHDVALAVAQGSKDYTDNSIEKLKWELGTYDLSVTTDSTVAYTKTIPTNTIKGRLNYIGGASKVSENLCSNTQNSSGNYDYFMTFYAKPNTTYFAKVFNINQSVNDSLITLCSTDSTSTIETYYNASYSHYLGNGFTFTTGNITAGLYRLRYVKNNAVETTGNAMIGLGSTIPTTFEPYFENIRNAKTTSVVASGTDVAPITKAIPSEIQALEGYGWGINDTCYNYVDLINKKFIPKVARVDLGSLNWTFAIDRFYSDDLKTLIGETYSGINYISLISNNYGVNTTGQGEDKTYFIYKGTSGSSVDKRLFVYDTTYGSDAQAFKTAMSGVYLYYELATPIETDISQYIDDSFKNIDTTNMTTITFENEFEYDVPSEIDYLIEEVKA